MRLQSLIIGHCRLREDNQTIVCYLCLNLVPDFRIMVCHTHKSFILSRKLGNGWMESTLLLSSLADFT